ncbi:unnamed protein product [Protopolystoma xenopodis]|uniref:Uncharacterized protein n=1 Tax=Protopolystoma xenopodis TaxID=117903 RepID=A0A3S5CQ37_9PLAT|nr:unnamed protein product [Protopolystoma xenopodis]
MVRAELKPSVPVNQRLVKGAARPASVGRTMPRAAEHESGPPGLLSLLQRTCDFVLEPGPVPMSEPPTQTSGRCQLVVPNLLTDACQSCRAGFASVQKVSEPLSQNSRTTESSRHCDYGLFYALLLAPALDAIYEACLLRLQTEPDDPVLGFAFPKG